ncbi:MAG TPA: hypothetical protein VH372_06390 [Actinospica sp.]|jgi:hypothetical protein|nr:hypothetical protein [Actinospica sp.]
MSGFDDEQAAITEYRRMMRAVAEHQVVDAAEAVLAHAWLTHLGEMRRCALDLVDATRSVHQEAVARLRAATSAEDPAEVAHAQAFVNQVEVDLDDDLAASRQLLACVEEHVELVCRAGYERVRRKQADLDRLKAARAAAYGEAPGVG